jgi:hypothetical protein
MKKLKLQQGGLANFQDAVGALRELGRFEDDTIAHVATGETIIPMEVFDENPELRDQVFSSMAKLGINPAEYIVGSNLNSINPVTGQPEFFLKKLFKKLKKAAPVLLPIAASFIPGAGPLLVGAAGTAGGLIGGQDPKQALLSGIMAGGLAGLGKGTQAFNLGNQAGGRSLGSSIFKGIQEGGLGTLFQGAKVAPTYTGVNGLAGGQGVAPITSGGTPVVPEVKKGIFETAKNLFREEGDPTKGYSKSRVLAGLMLAQQAPQLFSAFMGGDDEEEYVDTNVYPGDFGQLASLNFAPSYFAGSNIVSPLQVAQGGMVNEPVNGLKKMEGIARLAEGGFPEDARRAQGMLNGPGTGTSDSIPAYLSNGEFVVTAKAVKNAGGAKPMYEMMDYLEKGGKLSPQSRGNA